MPSGEPKWWVYVLRCADGTLYTGVTTDPDRRLKQHNAGTASKYTRARGPVLMVYREPTAGHGAALRREIAIKKMSRAVKDVLIATKPPRLSKSPRAKSPPGSRRPPSAAGSGAPRR
jgi:putative endonuclease